MNYFSDLSGKNEVERFLLDNIILSSELQDLAESNVDENIPVLERCNEKVLEGYGSKRIGEFLSSSDYNPIKSVRHDMVNNYAIVGGYISLYNGGNKELFNITRMNVIGTIIERTTLSIMDEMSDSFFPENYMQMKDLYSEFQRMPLAFIDGISEKKVNITVVDGVTSDLFLGTYAASNLSRIIHNIFMNKLSLFGSVDMLVRASRSDEGYEFCIYDTSGVPIPDSYHDPMDVCALGASSRGSSGIGLYVARELVKNLMMGEFLVERNNSDFPDPRYGGAKFKITLPEKSLLATC